MGMVLWSFSLKDNIATSDEADKPALCKHTQKLDALSAKLNIKPFSELLDSTDLEVNTSGEELPEGMEDTTQLMAQSGNWSDAQEAVVLMKTLLKHIQDDKIKFGILSDNSTAVMEELKEAIDFAEKARHDQAKFSLAMIM